MSTTSTKHSQVDSTADRPWSLHNDNFFMYIKCDDSCMCKIQRSNQITMTDLWTRGISRSSIKQASLERGDSMQLQYSQSSSSPNEEKTNTSYKLLVRQLDVPCFILQPFIEVSVFYCHYAVAQAIFQVVNSRRVRSFSDFLQS